jgi:hypothetical protein
MLNNYNVAILVEKDQPVFVGCMEENYCGGANLAARLTVYLAV